MYMYIHTKSHIWIQLSCDYVSILLWMYIESTSWRQDTYRHPTYDYDGITGTSGQALLWVSDVSVKADLKALNPKPINRCEGVCCQQGHRLAVIVPLEQPEGPKRPGFTWRIMGLST